MRRPGVLQGLVVVILVAIVIVILPLMQEAGGGLLPQQLIKKHPLVFWTGFAAVSTLAVVLYFIDSQTRKPPAASAPEGSMLWRTMSQLAKAVDDQWRDEAGKRRIGDNDPFLTVQWSVARQTPGEEGQAERSSLRGVDAVVAAYQAAGSGRMVILGDVGSGKTALMVLLTLGMVRRWRLRHASDAEHRPASGAELDPVPVLLSLAAWDPRKVGLRRWIAYQLAENYPFLRNRETFGRRAPERLVEGVPMVLPLLDGLDELEPTARVRAIWEIERADLPALVLTCRRSDYDRVMREGGGTVAAAAVVTIEALRAPDITLDVVSHGYAPHQGRRWTAVLTHIRERPASPLARAMSTPLMVSLARDVYRRPAADPRELLDPAAFPTEEAVQAHLLRALVRATFPELPERDRRDDWNGPDVERWLHFLAVNLGERRSIRWWELPLLARTPERVLAVVSGIAIVGAAMALGFGSLYGPMGAALAAASSALILGVPIGMSLPPPSELHVRGAQNIWPPLLSGLVAGVFVTITIGIKAGIKIGLLAGTVIGIPVGVTYSLAKPDATVRAVSPRQLLRWDIQVALVFGLLYTVTSGIVTGVVVSPVFGAAFGIACGLCGAFLYGPVWLFAFRVNKVGLIAWLHFVLTRLVLVPRGLLPWRTLAFFEEAHRRGLLRQVGPVYEFRHGLLQDVLAGRSPKA